MASKVCRTAEPADTMTIAKDDMSKRVRFVEVPWLCPSFQDRDLDAGLTRAIVWQLSKFRHSSLKYFN